MRCGARSASSSDGAGKKDSWAEPVQVPATCGLSRTDCVSSWTAGLWCRPAANLGKYRRTAECRKCGRRALTTQTGLGKMPTVRGERRAETATWADDRPGLARHVERPRLMYRTDLLREALDPATGERLIVVHVDERTPGHRRTPVRRVEQHQELAVLAAHRVEIFVVTGGELPVDEQRITVPRTGWIRIDAGRQGRGGGLRRRPELDSEHVADVVPGWCRREVGHPASAERIAVTLESFRCRLRRHTLGEGRCAQRACRHRGEPSGEHPSATQFSCGQ